MMFKNLNIAKDFPLLALKNIWKNSFLWWLLLVSLLPLLVALFLLQASFEQVLSQEITRGLGAVVDRKINEIDSYFQSQTKVVSLLASNPIINDALMPLASTSTNEADRAAANISPYLSRVSKQFKFTDIIIVSKSGTLLFSLVNPHLRGLVLTGDKYKNNELGKAFNFAKTLMETHLSNFIHTDQFNEPQMYIATPILHEHTPVGVLIGLINNTAIEKIISDPRDLGVTGETLVGTINSNNVIEPTVKLRNASILEFISSSKNMSPLMFNAFSEAIRGTQGSGVIFDHRMKEVLAVWRPVPLLSWGMLVKMDTEEAFAELYRSRHYAFLLSIVSVLMITIIALFISLRLQKNKNNLLRILSELEIAKNAAAEADVAKSRFLANMSHELRTPLNAIIGYSEMLYEDCEDQGITTFTDDLTKINSSGKHLLALINDILDLSKIEAGKMTIALEDVSVLTLIKEIESLTEPLIAKRGNRFKIDAEQIGEQTIMHTDGVKLRQCLLNLISNAAKFTENGAITLDVELIKQAEQQWISFAVSDTGIGITSGQLERLFKAFSQADYLTSRKYGGTGLGLFLTQQFCQLLGGKVTVASKIDKGSTFTIYLPMYGKLLPEDNAPQQLADKKDKVPVLKSVANESFNRNLPTVLIVDDDPEFHDYVDKNLSTVFQLIHAFTAREGLSFAEKYHPDAMTLDVVMPGTDGWEVLKDIKSKEELQDIPIIMITMSGNKELGYALGANDYLMKPVNANELYTTLSKQILGRPPHVLVVDDDPTMRDYLSRLLKKSGWQVDLAVNGKEALASIEKSMPSVMLLDLLMPEMDGFEVLERLRKNINWSQLPVVVLTGKDLTDEEKNKLHGGVQLTLKKDGYRRSDLLKIIKTKVDEFTARKNMYFHQQQLQSILEKANEPGGSSTNVEILSKNQTILIIDDEEAVHLSLTKTLTPLGYNLIHAFNGETGLVYAEKYLPDAILLDIIMSGIDGWQVLAKIKESERTQKIPVIMLSQIEAKKIAYARGVTDFFVKPVDRDLLINHIEKHIEGAKEIEILVVDDDDISRGLFIKMLKKSGWTLVEAKNGLEAIEKIRKNKPSLIILDLMMPEMDGFQVIERLQQNPQWRTIPVVVVSAKTLTDEEQEMLTSTVSGLFEKGSYRTGDLVADIHQLLKKIDDTQQK